MSENVRDEELIAAARARFVTDHNLASSGKANPLHRGAFGVNAPDFTDYVEFSEMSLIPRYFNQGEEKS